jgi:transposase-like protein
VQIVYETYAPGMSVLLVARQYGIAPNQVFAWRLCVEPNNNGGGSIRRNAPG